MKYKMEFRLQNSRICYYFQYLCPKSNFFVNFIHFRCKSCCDLIFTFQDLICVQKIDISQLWSYQTNAIIIVEKGTAPTVICVMCNLAFLLEYVDLHLMNYKVPNPVRIIVERESDNVQRFSSMRSPRLWIELQNIAMN